MKTIIILIAVLSGCLAFVPEAEARFLFPRLRLLDCSTASPGGGGEWEVGCRCVQSGWITGGMIIPDNIIGCHLGLGANDRCNFHGQCMTSFGGGGSGGVAGSPLPE